MRAIIAAAAGGNAANDPPLAAISGYGGVAGGLGFRRPRPDAEMDIGQDRGHQLRIVDVGQDGHDDIADGNCVVPSDGTLRYVVEGSVHGDRFYIGDLDPKRPGPEGYAIQQTEGGFSPRTSRPASSSTLWPTTRRTGWAGRCVATCSRR
ncbi:hypothetical protein Aph02nite_21800 [Actinoplanes philippinensis]|uniref:Rhamnogalacturonan lyase family 11 C-terminal domain-containing protein n=1 Tax=Actinoplanes philippinensis TaxID=35752 RepID=A0A1I2C308_9ACTN|nr:hypothetical protein [Actinoplanes philippinensis]GIE76230.1 hypothetical protein Aph02nite_21800 [Actinoplanes philippinensis]SFE62123.1 hypothetical protein SAMN05421541_102648 [Actinoplanes philippinensis]